MVIVIARRILIRRIPDEERALGETMPRPTRRLGASVGVGGGSEVAVGSDRRPVRPGCEPMTWEPMRTTATTAAAAEAEGNELAHDGHPPRADEGPLWLVFNLGTDRVEDLVVQLLLALEDELVDQAVGISRRGHANRSWEGGAPGVSLDAGPERPCCVVQAGLRSPDGNSGSCRHLGDRKPEVVVEDEDGALLNGEPPEGPLEQVAVIHGQVVVGAVRARDGKDPRGLGPPLATPGLGIARVGEDAVEPRFEAGWVAQASELGPGRDQGGLDGVLGQVDVAEDPHRDRQASVAHHARQGVERFRVALLRLTDQLFLHSSLHTRGSRPTSGPITFQSVRGSLTVQSRPAVAMRRARVGSWMTELVKAIEGSSKTASTERSAPSRTRGGSRQAHPPSS